MNKQYLQTGDHELSEKPHKDATRTPSLYRNEEDSLSIADKTIKYLQMLLDRKIEELNRATNNYNMEERGIEVQALEKVIEVVCEENGNTLYNPT